MQLWSTLAEMAPYLLFGFGVAGILSVLVSQETVERHIGGRGFMPVFKAALFGVPLPLCSCGVIPVAASLKKHGASKGATLAFLISTPQTGVDSILVTYSLLGLVFAVFRPVVALVTGLIGGWLADISESNEEKNEHARNPAPCHDECCHPHGGASKLVRAIRYGFVILPRDIARPLLVGLLAAGVIAALVPKDFFLGTMGSGIGQMFVMMLIGIPIYVCATASVPIAASLILKGVSPGAALVFLITGPATNAAAIAAIWKMLGRKTALIYLGTVAVTALGAGILLNHLFVLTGIDPAHAAHQMLSPWIGNASAIILLCILGFALLPARKSGAHPLH
jgi:uncharacterized protein